MPNVEGLLLGDDLIGEGKLLAEGKVIKLHEIKSHKPTTLKTGYPNARPLSTKLLTYLGSEEGVKDYIRGHMTPEPSPATPPRVGFHVGDIVIYLRDEGDREAEVVATEAQVNEREVELVRGEGSEKKAKKKNKKKRTEEEEVPKSSKKKHKKTAEETTKERSVEAVRQGRKELVEALTARTKPAEGYEKPLQKTKRALVFEATPEDEPQSPIKLASDIAREEDKKSMEESGVKDPFGTQPKPTPHATHATTSAVLVQKGIEEGPHSPIPTQTIRTEDIPSSSVPPYGEAKSTSPSQKAEGVVSHVHLPQDTSPPHTEAFVASVTHESEHPTASEMAVRDHTSSVVLEQPKNLFIRTLEEASGPFPFLTKPIDRTSIDASFVEHRGLEGNPPEINLITGSEGTKHSLAKSGTCVVPEVTSDTFVIKGKFKAFVDMVF
ncbi:hypothetical protein L6452_15197 [Arctium lappa]|uniref:Uncharacterized protein n=1 Tax=Arctium lappa TaxID=4217 RepID=A0ACB9CMY5_ARCLA|nr:hypothetical protein L6452_15197 [Arctium lappa]